MEYFSAWDDRLLVFINLGLSHPWNDALMILWSKEWPWAILTLFFALSAWRKRSWILAAQLLWTGLSLGLTDAVAYYVIKPWIGRVRPCKDIYWSELIRVIDGCAGTVGFPSNHASNAAVFACLWFLFRGSKSGVIALCCCLLVSFSRVYLGVHYPSDVIGGMIYGALMGLLSYSILLSTPRLRSLTGKSSEPST